jgi:hypothetical protein
LLDRPYDQRTDGGPGLLGQIPQPVVQWVRKVDCGTDRRDMIMSSMTDLRERRVTELRPFGGQVDWPGRDMATGCQERKEAQRLKPRSLLDLCGPTGRAAEKVPTGRESNTSGAKQSAEKSLDEGHGFSRAVEYATGEGFSP